MTIKESGRYLVTGNVVLGATYAGNSYYKVYRNGTYWFALGGGTAQNIIYANKILLCNAGDVLSFYAVQNSGSAGTMSSAILEMVKLS